MNWVNLIKSDMKKHNLNISEDLIPDMTTLHFKKIIKEEIREELKKTAMKRQGE